nr:GspE/PulE family protein [uncultured Desulfobacter sp.]
MIWGKAKEEQFDTVEQINAIVGKAIDARASDIHFEPFENIINVRFRIDGALVQVAELPIRKHDEITARIKVMGSLDSISKRAAQDGKILFEHNGRIFEIRVAVMPVRYGEKSVFRILRSADVTFDINNIGINSTCLPVVKRTISKRQGLVLVTGSTGSGKTTTIYSVLEYINCQEINIVTVEDPIEFEIKGINQVQISKDHTMSFADVLKAVLRQDPDVLVIGEIRDPETARVAIQAALTGHLVIASLHTNDAIDTIVRLTEMGIKTYLIAAALKMIISQRLIRLLCPHCKQPGRLTPDQAAMFDLDQSTPVFVPTGCRHCSQTGYRGRTSIFEILSLNDQVIEILARHNKSYELKTRLKDLRTSVLKTEALEHILLGNTACDEVLKQVV